jgi:hypothetical protein
VKKLVIFFNFSMRSSFTQFWRWFRKLGLTSVVLLLLLLLLLLDPLPVDTSR